MYLGDSNAVSWWRFLSAMNIVSLLCSDGALAWVPWTQSKPGEPKLLVDESLRSSGNRPFRFQDTVPSCRIQGTAPQYPSGIPTIVYMGTLDKFSELLAQWSFFVIQESCIFVLRMPRMIGSTGRVLLAFVVLFWFFVF